MLTKLLRTKIGSVGFLSLRDLTVMSTLKNWANGAADSWSPLLRFEVGDQSLERTRKLAAYYRKHKLFFAKYSDSSSAILSPRDLECRTHQAERDITSILLA